MTYRPTIFCRLVLAAAALAVSATVAVVFDVPAALVPAAAFVWLGRGLWSLRVDVYTGCIVKRTGRLMKSTAVFNTSSLCCVHTVAFLPLFPALVKLVYPTEKVYIIGLNGAQVQAVRQAVSRFSL